MKARFAIISAVSVWLYAVSDLVKHAVEISVRAKLLTGGAGYSTAEYAVEVVGCQKALLIVGCISLLLFIADIVIGIIEKRKSSANQIKDR